MDIMELEEKFIHTCKEFQAEIRRLSIKHKKPIMQIYGWWREYSNTCRNYDQSADLPEFKEWYKKELES